MRYKEHNETISTRENHRHRIGQANTCRLVPFPPTRNSR